MSAWRVRFTCTPTEPAVCQTILSEALRRQGGRAAIDGRDLTIELPLWSERQLCLEEAARVGRDAARRIIFNAGLTIAMEIALSVTLAHPDAAVTDLALRRGQTDRPPAA